MLYASMGERSTFDIQPSPSPLSVDRRARGIVALYALLALIVIPVFPNFPSPNEFTRWALVAAVVERHTLEVSKEATLLGPGFEDLAIVDGRIYSNKAPGIALAAAPGYIAARPALGPPSRENLRSMLTVMRWFGSTLPLLALALLFEGAARRRGAESTGLAIASLLFATPLFAYGLLLFSHALVGAALFAAWALLYLRDDLPRPGGSTTPAADGRSRHGHAGWPLLAGALIGIAVLSEYPVAIAAAVLVGGLAAGKQWKKLLLVLGGGAPFAALLALYQQAAFGSALAAAYRFEKLPQFRTLGAQGIGGIGLPSPAILANMLFHPARGLLLFSPILLACVAALPRARRSLAPAAFLTLLLTPLSILLVYSGYPNWHGGWTLSSRYVVSMLPFVIFPLAFAPVRAWTAVLFGWSVAAVGLSTLTFPFVPLDFPLPWGSLAMPLLGHGLAAPNLFHALGRPAAIGVPLVLLLIAIAMATSRRLVLASAVGVALSLMAGWAAMQATVRDPRPLIERAYFEDVYFGQRGVLDNVVQAHIASPRLLQRRAAELPYGPSEWPF